MGSLLVIALFLISIVITSGFPISWPTPSSAVTPPAWRQVFAAETTGQSSGVVSLDGETVFIFRTGFGGFPPQQRAAAVQKRLQAFADNRAQSVDDIHILAVEGIDVITGGQVNLTAVLPIDAQAAGKSQRDLAAERRQAIVAAVQAYRQRRVPADRLRGTVYSAIATLVLVVVALVLRRGIAVGESRLVRYLSSRMGALRLQNLELLSSQQILQLLAILGRLLKWIVTLSLLAVYLICLLSFFPETQVLTRRVLTAVLEVVAGLWKDFVNYLPKLLNISAIVLITHAINRFLKFFFRAIETGMVTFQGFYREWAQPTYRLLAFLTTAFAVALIFPFLPGYESDAFKGLSIFLGILVSLGSTAAISNLIAGFTLIYTRAFQVGDCVQMDGELAMVEEGSLLVTRLRLVGNNMVVTIPNSIILSSSLKNYTASIRESQTPVVLGTTLTLGYDVPWRQLHATLIAAARATPGILSDPEPFVLQKSLDDFYVSYELKAATHFPECLPRIYSDLHQNIQDFCADVGIEIMSPHYTSLRDGTSSTIPVRDQPQQTDG
jgi:small-conductance mechanosensitive channel